MADLISHGHEMAYLKGDPGELAGEVRRMKNVAATIDKLSGMLDDIHNKRNSQSERIDKIREAAGDGRSALAKVRDLYNDTGWALDAYQQQLATSVTDAKRATDSARSIVGSVTSAETAADEADKKKANPPDGTDPGSVDTTTPGNHRDRLQSELHGYKEAWFTAYDDLNTAANTAKGRISKAVDDSPAKDSWWDNVAGVLKAITSVLGWIILVVAIIALFATGPFAAILIGIAIGLTAANLIMHSALALTGKGSWVDVGLDIIGLIPFGRLAGPASKGAKALSILRGTLRNAVPIRGGVKAAQEVLEMQSLLRAATLAQSTSRSGNVWADWARLADGQVAGARSATSFLDVIKQGGSRDAAQIEKALDALAGNNGGRNIPARAAISAAQEAVGPGGGHLAVPYVAGQAGGGAWLGHDVATGDDWTVNQVTGLFHDGPGAADLKSRVQAAPMLVGAAPTTNPYG